MIDTHCHLYVDEFKADISEVIERALAAGVESFYLPAIDSSEHVKMILLQERYPAICKAMMGLHPCSVKADYMEELKVVEEWLSKRRFAAIGEIGLDFYWDTSFTNQQYKAFRMQIELALQYKLPIVIHTRNAMKQTIEVVEEYVPKGVRGIFHCFGGSIDEAKRIIDAGFYLGIGGVVTYKNAGLAQVLENIDLKFMVLETDAPYLTPVPYRGKRNECSYLKYIIEKLAQVKNVSVADVEAATTANAKKIFAY